MRIMKLTQLKIDREALDARSEPFPSTKKGHDIPYMVMKDATRCPCFTCQYRVGCDVTCKKYIAYLR